MKGTVEITVDDAGHTTVEAKDVTGPGCEAFTRELQDALGATVSDTRKPEYAQRTTVAAQKKARA